jgi:LAGLIDADG endonuclease
MQPIPLLLTDQRQEGQRLPHCPTLWPLADRAEAAVATGGNGWQRVATDGNDHGNDCQPLPNFVQQIGRSEGSGLLLNATPFGCVSRAKVDRPFQKRANPKAILLSSYITGLIEGDGTIVVPKREISDKGKLNYPSVQIVFNLKDFPLCQVIQKLIGHGTISKKKQSAAYILTINNFEGLITLCSLINGKMRGPKYHQLVLLISYINKKFPDINLKPLGFSSTPLGTDSWLTGFIEADGGFQVRNSINTKVPRISLSFELVQSRITHYGYNMFDLMNQIALFLDVNLNEIRSERKHPQYRVRTSSLKTNLTLRDYLSNYPLRSTKYLDYLDWAKVLSFFEQGTHRENTEQIANIKSQMNQRRTVYNWDHLQFTI